MRRPIAFRVLSLAVAGTIVAATIAVPSAQRRGRADNAAQGVPVATNTIVEAPDRYYGKLVTVSAGVEEMLSKTTFLLDQRRAGVKQVQAIGRPLLVIAPYLTASFDRSNYLLVRGEVVKLDAAALARLAPGDTLDLAPDVGATYQAQPVLVANSVGEEADPATESSRRLADLGDESHQPCVHDAASGRAGVTERCRDRERREAPGGVHRDRSNLDEPQRGSCGEDGARRTRTGGVDRDRRCGRQLG